MSFLDFLEEKRFFDSWPKRSSEKVGTTIVALKYKGGVAIGCDSQVTELKSLNRFPQSVEKIVAIENHSAIGIVGAPNVGLAIARTFKASLSATQRIYGFLSAEGRAKILEALVGKYFPLVLESEGQLAAAFIFVTFDGGGRIFFCDPTAFSIEISKFFATGSGGEHAYYTVEKDWKKNLTEQEAVKLLLASLEYAASRNKATGAPYFLFVVDEKGVRKVALREVKNDRA